MLNSRTLLLTATAMVAFAANSVLCRLGLGAGLIDAASYSSIRLVSGAVMLALLVLLRGGSLNRRPDLRMVAGLFVYVVCFSYAYLTLDTATGALVLFAAVQLTMFAVSLAGGERFNVGSWLGLALALGGLIYLLLPSASSPDPLGAVLMATAGVAWGVYSLCGRAVTDATTSTALNFVYAAPVAVAVGLVLPGEVVITASGTAYAVASGAVASGLGYAIWYRALPGLAGTQAATVQLSVPVIAALGGLVFLSEALSVRLIVATAATLGGVAIVLRRPGS
ncbi:MAG: DMT family transporter [Pseudomonadota bacterium]